MATPDQIIVLDADNADDPKFLGIVAKLVSNTARAHEQSRIDVVRIDHWFGKRWLGFHGKILGQHGVRDRARRPSEVIVPPFHPNRVLSESQYALSTGGTFDGPMPPGKRLHAYRTGEENTRLRIPTVTDAGVVAWYSAATKESGRGALLVYVLGDVDERGGWYAGFERGDAWRLTERVGIGDAEWNSLLKEGGSIDALRTSQ